MERRQKNMVGFGRPLGSDGFDFSYRMTVDQRYQKVALRKAQLYRLFIAQVACQALGILWVALVMLQGREVSKIVLLSITSGIIAITSGEIGRRRTNSMLLMLYISASSFATALSVMCGSSGHLSGEQFTRDSNQYQDRDSLSVLFDTLETWRIFIGVLLQIVAMLATVSLLQNMSPRRA